MDGNANNTGNKLPKREKDTAAVVAAVIVAVLVALAVIAFFVGHNNKVSVPVSATASVSSAESASTGPSGPVVR